MGETARVGDAEGVDLAAQTEQERGMGREGGKRTRMSELTTFARL